MICYQAGYTYTTAGTNCVIIGYQAGYSCHANNNCFIGYQVGKNCTSGQYNSCLGFASGLGLTTGSFNSFLDHKRDKMLQQQVIYVYLVINVVFQYHQVQETFRLVSRLVILLQLHLTIYLLVI